MSPVAKNILWIVFAAFVILLMVEVSRRLFKTGETVALSTEPAESSDQAAPSNPPSDSAADDVRILDELVVSFLTAVKDPYRPPLGINEDFARALTGGNRYGDVFIASNHPSINNQGQLVDRWGTPYHFHPRAADAIDIRSAGPDRTLFTDDDILSR